MQRNDDGSTFSRLRMLAATDPRRARQLLGEMLDSATPHLKEVFTRAAAPGEGRLRQLIANTLRVRGEQERFAAHLQAWREVEPDEFTRRALDAALEGTRHTERSAERRATLVDRHLVESYRYVSDRLKHQLRNAMMEPMTHLLRLRGLVATLKDPHARSELSAQIACLADAVQQVGQVVEFDAGDDYFTVRRVSLTDWLTAFNVRYAGKFKAVRLTLQPTGPFGFVLASDYLLDTVFWNLWINAHQAVGPACAIKIRFAISDRRIELLVRDNGDGFPREVGEAGLSDAKPRQGHRGRGLLEVQDAIERVHGAATFVRDDDGTYRIHLSFPREP